MDTKWNTGRQYTTDGQIIYARVSDGVAMFVDISRGIMESWPTTFEPRDENELRAYIMKVYDGSRDYKEAQGYFKFDQAAMEAGYAFRREIYTSN